MITRLGLQVEQAEPVPQSPQAADPPLAIDLDGTLVRVDLLHESLLRLLVAEPSAVLSMPGWLVAGKAKFKTEVARRVELDASHLPYNAALLEWLRAEKVRGRRIVLCTASDLKLANSVAAHLGLFDEVMASDGHVNLASTRKADALVTRFGPREFDYAGNSFADLAIWKVARHAIVVNASAPVRAAVSRAAFVVEREFPTPSHRFS